MALSAPSWRLPIRCTKPPRACSNPSPVLNPSIGLANGSVSRPIQHYQRRFASSNDNSSNNDDASSNPILEEWKRNNPEADKSAAKPTPPSSMTAQGDIANSSIFEDERRATKQQEEDALTPDTEDAVSVGGYKRDPRNMAHVLDPHPASREDWERRQIIKMVRKNGRLTKHQFYKRTEREHTVKSHNFKTSIKKLGPLARQIAGKTLEDAIVQMRFSKKKIAQEVLTQLEFARDEAVVMRGMGLPSTAREDADDVSSSSPSISGYTSQELEQTSTTGGMRKTPTPTTIRLKNGKAHKVLDASKIYIDQAWVNRGPYGQLPDYRARGRMNLMRTPWTSLTVVLKEEATRIREWEQREAKHQRQLKAKAFKALPDRPLQIQRQWYSW